MCVCVCWEWAWAGGVEACVFTLCVCVCVCMLRLWVCICVYLWEVQVSVEIWQHIRFRLARCPSGGGKSSRWFIFFDVSYFTSSTRGKKPHPIVLKSHSFDISLRKKKIWIRPQYVDYFLLKYMETFVWMNTQNVWRHPRSVMSQQLTSTLWHHSLLKCFPDSK